MDIVIGVIVGLLVLMFLVIVHEFGHFLAARRNGVNVLEFGIGFPPRAIAWIKDPKTGRWRRLPRREWTRDKMTKVVISEGKGLKGGGLAQRGMIFSLNWLPIGGFCQMDGESDAEKRKGTLGAASYWAKTKILFAGVGMNWLVAAIILMILAWTGMPEFINGQFSMPVDSRVEWVPVQVSKVMEDSPATKAGFEVGDFVLQAGDVHIEGTDDIASFDSGHAEQQVKYTVVRGINDECAKRVDWQGDWRESLKEVCEGGGTVVDLDVTLNKVDSEYMLGIAMKQSEKKTYSTWSAPLVGIGLTAQLTGETFRGLGIMVYNLVTGVGSQFSPDASVRESGQEAITEVGDSVSGPVGIIGVLFPAFTAAGPTNLAFLTALISVSLACMNVLPIPALDGGRWFLITIFKLRKKKLTKEIEEKIVSRAFLVLIALIFIVTVLDIMRIAR